MMVGRTFLINLSTGPRRIAARRLRWPFSERGRTCGGLGVENRTNGSHQPDQAACWNPSSSPNEGSMTGFAERLMLRYPAAASALESRGIWDERRKSPFQWHPVSHGGRPVKRLACDGIVQGAGLIARGNTTDSRRSSSANGIPVIPGDPPMKSAARTQSSTTTRMFGLEVALDIEREGREIRVGVNI